MRYAWHMPRRITGVVHGNAVLLDDPVPPLEGRRVRVELEAIDGEVTPTDEALRGAWQAWVASGPQGPLDDDTDFPDATG